MAKILHIDDVDAWTRDFKKSAEERGHEVFPLNTLQPPSRLFQLLIKHEFDLIICDGSVNRTDDGAHLAYALKKLGYRVALMSCSSYGFKDLPELPVSISEDAWKRIDQILDPTK